jgi:hypothetical protein
MALIELLRQRGTLRKGTATRSSTGDEIIVWAETRSAVPCLVRLQPFLADLQPGTSRVATHTIVTPILREVLDEPKGFWELLVDGREYLFIEPRNPAARDHHMEIHTRRLA